MSESDKILDKIAGVIYGTAIGDALGYPVEFQHVMPSSPEVTDLRTKGRGYALFSDDTQMMWATFEGLSRARTWTSLDRAAEEVAAAYIAWSQSPDNNRAPGGACMLGCHNLAQGKPWRASGKPDGGGCGAAMRAMAYGVWHYKTLWAGVAWAAEHALMTHQHPMAQASAAAVSAGVSAAMRGGTPDWIATLMVDAAGRYHEETRDMLVLASEGKLHDADFVLDKWRGWAGHEAVAASLWCFLQHPDDYEKAVLLAVNSPGDSDSLGAITGALVGARLGASAIPEKWKKNIEKSAELELLAGRIWRQCREDA